MEERVRQSIFRYAKLFSLLLFLVCICGTSALAATTTYSVSGSVTAGGTGVPSIHVALTGGAVNKTVSTDSHGNYNFTNIAAGDYTITPSGNGCTFDPPSYSSVSVGPNSTGNNFTVTFAISGTVTMSGPGDSSGVTVTLSGATGATTTTDANGKYSFSPLSQGAYTITPTKLAYTFSPPHRTVPIKTAGSTASNFVAKEVTYSISGTASTGNPVADAPVDLVDSAGAVLTAAATTSSSGHFSIHSTGIKPPFMLSVQTSSGPLYSVSSNWNASATINLTPLTDTIIRSWYGAQGVDMATAFANPATYPPPTPTDVLVLRTMVQNTVQTWLQAAGVKTASFNAISTPFTANGKGVDGVLNLINEVPSAGGVINVTINGNPKTESPAIQNMSVNLASPNPTVQNTIFNSSSGNLTVTTTATVSGNTGSTTTTSSVVPTSQEEEDALAGINTTITNFVNTVNQKGHSLQASDLLQYVVQDFQDNGLSRDEWAADRVSEMAGLKMSYSGLQLNSLDTGNNIANVTFQVTIGNQINTVTLDFKLVSGTWLVCGNGRVADIEVFTWGWYHPEMDPQDQYTHSTQFNVYDPQPNNVQSVTVSGPGITGSQDVPKVCDYDPTSGFPLCGNSHGSDKTQRAFEFDMNSFWPPVGSTYTFTVTTGSGDNTYTFTIGNEYGFDNSGNPVPADYPPMTLTSPPPFTQILNGITVKGSVYIPIWSATGNDQLHFNFEGPGGTSNNVSNIDVVGQWIGTPVPGQWNSFTMTIPKPTNVTPFLCNGGATCYTITFQGQTGDIQGGWFGFDANDHMGGFTNSGVDIHE